MENNCGYSLQIKVILLLFFIASSSCNNNTHKLIQLFPDATILAFGNSLTLGVGANIKQDYPSQLAKISNFNVINAGISGEISSEGLKRLPSVLDKYKPNLLILIHGGNDILRKMSHNALKQNLINMIKEAQTRNIQVVMLGVPEPGVFIKSAKIYEEVAKETRIPIENSLLAEILKDNSLKSDSVHPNEKGYQVLANGIYKFLKKEGAFKQ